MLFTSVLRSSHKPRKAQKILSLYCHSESLEIRMHMTGSDAREHCWYHFLMTSRSVFLAALLWFLRIPSLCFSISAKAKIYHACLLWHTHRFKILYRSFLHSKIKDRGKAATLKEGLTFLFVLYGSFQLSYTSQTVLIISKNIHKY